MKKFTEHFTKLHKNILSNNFLNVAQLQADNGGDTRQALQSFYPPL
ncbi:hypothetical protein [Methylovulum psychrotolerans]|nr:hypothetical protein [Methylovulum psychrotolerans]MBT9096805.1 hypothetical protein [Methylovulum psychrotolerans]